MGLAFVWFKPTAFMYHKHVPAYTELLLCTFFWKAFVRSDLPSQDLFLGYVLPKWFLAQTTSLSLLSCSCKKKKKKNLPYYHQGSAPLRENNDVKFRHTSSMFHPSLGQQFPLDTSKEKGKKKPCLLAFLIDGCWLVKCYDRPPTPAGLPHLVGHGAATHWHPHWDSNWIYHDQ